MGVPLIRNHIISCRMAEGCLVAGKSRVYKKMKTWTQALPYFPEKDLACKGTGIIKLDFRFVAPLIHLRHTFDAPMNPSSTCRTPARNKQEGGHFRSLHLTNNPHWPTYGCAAMDVTWKGWSKAKKLRFARLAYKHGFSVGLHPSFCHIDWRTECAKLPQMVFTYGSWNHSFSKEDVRNA